MVNVDLRPPPKNPDSLLTYLNTNFTRVQDAFSFIEQVKRGNDVVNPTLDIDTGLSEIYSVVASMSSVPSSTGAFIRARVLDPSGQPGVIRLTVYDENLVFDAGNVATVNWIAIGV